MFESSECFEAYAIIDYCHYMLAEIQKDMNKKRSPIDIMIDNASGYSKAKADEVSNQIISLFEEIIKNKRILGAPISGNVKSLKEIKKMVSSGNQI